MSELDFNNISLGDVTLGGKPIAEGDQQTVTTEEGVKETSADGVPESNVTTTEEAKTEAPADTTAEPAKPTAVVEKTATVDPYNFKDDFIKGVVEYYEKTGDITPYLQAKLVDFNQMSDEEIMRRSLREQYPDVSDKAFERLYRQQIVDKYKLDPDEYGEDDFELGQELLKSEAAKSRQKYVDWQNGFKAPEPSNDDSQEQEQASVREAIQKFEQSVKSNDLTKNILENKRLAIKVGDDEFNYEIPEPDSIVDMTVDNEKFFSQFVAGEGQLDFSKWYKTAAYSQNPELFEKALINYGKTLGRSEVTKEIKNPSSNSVGDVPTDGSGDFTSGLLRAFADRGVSK
jgi:hypothetical protein